MDSTTRGRAAKAAVLAGMLCGALTATAYAGTKTDLIPKLKSGSVLIIDQNDSQVLYSRNSDVAAPGARRSSLSRYILRSTALNRSRRSRPSFG